MNTENTSSNTATQAPNLFGLSGLFETDRLDLAALLLARGLTFVSARSDGNWKYFQFEDKEKCEEIKKDYDFGSPTVKLHEYEAAKRRLNRIVHT